MHSITLLTILLYFFFFSFQTSLSQQQQALPLIIPDEQTNTKLILCKEGLNFLRQFKENNIAIVSVAGRAKTGKSFLLNHLLGVDHQNGFSVQVSFKPGTKGISIWSKPFKVVSSSSSFNGDSLSNDNVGKNNKNCKKKKRIKREDERNEFLNVDINGGNNVNNNNNIQFNNLNNELTVEDNNTSDESTLCEEEQDGQQQLIEGNNNNKQKETIILFIDSEGLGAPGNPSSSYDPKLAALTLSISSLLIYNLNHEIQISDVNTLHSVVTLSKVFENQFNETFPFPPILWTVQQYEHDLLNYTPEDYLRWVLKEKPNIRETEEIRRYNETVRVVKNNFPDFLQPRILLLNHPNKLVNLPQLVNLKFNELDKEYQNQITYLRKLIFKRTKPKVFKHMLVSGEFLANLIETLVKHMNLLDTADVGIAFIKELTIILKQKCIELFQLKLMNISLPQDVPYLEQLNLKYQLESLELFKNNCTGKNLNSFENYKYYLELKLNMENIFKEILPTNSMTSFQNCTGLLNKLFEQYVIPKNSDNQYSTQLINNVEQFDKAIEMMKQLYFQQAKGPEDVKLKVLNNFEQSTIIPARNRILDRNTVEDLTLIVFSLVLITFIFYLIGIIPKSIGCQQISAFLLGFSYLTGILTILIILAWFNVMGLRFSTINYQLLKIKMMIPLLIEYWNILKYLLILILIIFAIFVILKIYHSIFNQQNTDYNNNNMDYNNQQNIDYNNNNNSFNSPNLNEDLSTISNRTFTQEEIVNVFNSFIESIGSPRGATNNNNQQYFASPPRTPNNNRFHHHLHQFISPTKSTNNNNTPINNTSFNSNRSNNNNNRNNNLSSQNNNRYQQIFATPPRNNNRGNTNNNGFLTPGPPPLLGHRNKFKKVFESERKPKRNASPIFTNNNNNINGYNNYYNIPPPSFVNNNGSNMNNNGNNNSPPNIVISEQDSEEIADGFFD
ncbi:hypothetical protein ABK040_014108 [Willaertia magna]